MSAAAALVAFLLVPCACALVVVYVPIWIGLRLGWWR